MSGRDCSPKCLMKDEALCSDYPDGSRAARGGNGFLKSHPFSSRARWRPSGAHELEASFHIYVRLCTFTCNTHTYAVAICFAALPKVFLSFLPASHSLPLLVLLWEPTGYMFAFLLDIYPIWQVTSPTSHSYTISPTFCQS